MTLRITEAEQEALRLRAQHEGRSMQEVAREAIREYTRSETHRELIDKGIEYRLRKDAELIWRLSTQ